MKRQKIYEPHARDHVQFLSLWSELYCRQALQQGNVRAQVCLGSVLFCACWTLGWKKAKLLRLEFWCFPSPHCCCFNTGLPCLASSVCLTMGGWSALLLPYPLPSLMLHDFWSCHFQVDMEITSNVLALSQPVPARTTTAALRTNIIFCSTWICDKLGWYSWEKQ